jgi:uncharacterized membrane protein YgcG
MQLNTKLWSSITDFDLHQYDQEYGFTARLMKEQNWTTHFTESAILEYKKFMYLAAVSSQMVSPSEIVDLVWHQHLIFTQSYNDFCKILGKRIEHIPSTGSHSQRAQFDTARSFTENQYNSYFGEQDPAFWKYATMEASLGLKPARTDMQTFFLIAIPGFLVALLLSYYTIGKLLYPILPSAVFIPTIAGLFIPTSIFMYRRIRNKARKFLKSLPSGNFLFHLSFSEILAFKYQNSSYLIQCHLNEALKKGILNIDPARRKITLIGPHAAKSPEEKMIAENLSMTEPMSYAGLEYRLRKTFAFNHPIILARDFSKRIVQSNQFGKLFKWFFITHAILVVLAITRILTGIERERPVGFIVVLTLVGIACWISQQIKLQRTLFTRSICDFIEANPIVEKMETMTDFNHYYMKERRAFDPLLLLVIPAALDQFFPTGNDSGSGSGGCGGSGCGSSCGSSCGGGCGGCGS